MRKFYIYALISLLCVGCGIKDPISPNGGLDRTRSAEVTLSAINVAGGNAATRATEPVPMKVGERFRLYAFEHGVTDMRQLISTRTYAIQTQAGMPVLEAGQQPLYLPLGNLDIYLVGPIEVDFNAGKVDEDGNQLPANTITVASATSVTPSVGVDLISSRTELTVEMGANQFTANALQHKMARTEVVMLRPTDGTATYKDLKVNTVVINKQVREGSFVFDEHGGTITPVGEGGAEVRPTVIEETAGERYTAVAYCLPRQATQMEISVYFSCVRLGKNVTESRLSSGSVSNIALKGGEINRFTTDINLSELLEFRHHLLPWDDITLPDFTLPNTEGLLFSYSGMDAPTVINGKRYWLDRSGNKRHAELVGDIVYNAAGRYYYSNAANAFIRVPKLGNIPIYTLEIAAETMPSNEARIVNFAHEGAENLAVVLPKVGNDVEFAAGRTDGRLWHHDAFANDKGYLQNLTSYAFTRNATKLSASRNGQAFGTPVDITGKAEHGDFTENRLLASSGAVAPTKLYAVRLTAKDLQGTVSLKENYRNDMASFANADVVADVTTQSYIKHGLVVDLRGDKDKTETLWKDQSEMHKDATVKGTPTMDATSYIFTGSQSMQLLTSMGSMQSYTVEFVTTPDAAGGNVLFHFSSVNNSDQFREFYVNFGANSVQMDSPHLNGRGESHRWDALTATFPYASYTDKTYQYSVTRTSGSTFQGLSVNQCGLGVAAPSVASTTPLEAMKFCHIGQDAAGGNRFKGKIHAVRVYNRVLTDKERQINYLVDKTKYSLLY